MTKHVDDLNRKHEYIKINILCAIYIDITEISADGVLLRTRNTFRQRKLRILFRPIKYGIFKGTYANFCDIFIISLDLFFLQIKFSVYFLSACNKILLKDLSLIELASLFIFASPAEILLDQFFCFFLRWIQFCPIVRLVIYLPIWTQL